MLEIECKECGYRGSTDTTRSFDVFKFGKKHNVLKYVCPKCGSRNIEYKPRPNMEWLAWMSRTKELKELQKGKGKK